MQRSILHYRSLLDEMESHNSTETQRLDSLQDALRHGAPLSAQQKHEVQHLRRCTEELRLTKRKAIYMKKGLLMAQAKLADINHQHRYLHLLEARLSNFQPLPNDDDDHDDGDGVHSPLGASSPLSVASSDGGVGAAMAVCFPGESSRSGDGDEDAGVVVVVSDAVVPSLLQKHKALRIDDCVGEGVGGCVGGVDNSILDSKTSCVQSFHDMEAFDHTENFAIAVKVSNTRIFI
uniref:Uncharacterized protein n=1 Tax=Physcomitrium patens TaxID=3218 RepID=A0A2K1IUJ1_PHYPA|nr:hypothetical protein PHYPA_024892 [Physcomitrium patens]